MEAVTLIHTQSSNENQKSEKMDERERKGYVKLVQGLLTGEWWIANGGATRGGKYSLWRLLGYSEAMHHTVTHYNTQCVALCCSVVQCGAVSVRGTAQSGVLLSSAT